MGIFNGMINNIMIPMLSFFYTLIPNYGIAIILLTVLVKVVMAPLTHKQYVSMKNMQKIQPLFKEIKQKHSDDPVRLQKEIMALYKQHKVSPLGGCLPVLVQLPVLFGLFYTMTSDGFKALLAEPGVFQGLTTIWLPNLTQADHFYILPILIGLTTYYAQKLTPTTMDKNQARLMMFMPVLMVVISLKMPAGVLLYWASSQAISTIQQLWIMKPKEKTSIMKRSA